MININLPNDLNSIKLLNLQHNNFSSHNLSFLVNTVNLEQLVDNNVASLNYTRNLKKLKKIIISDIEVNEFDFDQLPASLEQIYYSFENPTDKLIQQLKEYKWEDIHSDFNLYRRRKWEKQNFLKEQTKEWIKAGVKSVDYKFASYLRDVKNLTPQWVFDNKESEEYKELRSELNKYGWCKICQQINVSAEWCQSRSEQEWKKDLVSLTDQELIEKFFQQHPNKNFRRIPYEQFSDIETLAEGGFSKVYKAKWDGWRAEFYGYGTVNKGKVALKILTNFQKITLEFLTEIANNKLAESGAYVNKCYGISQDPNTGNYIMVMDYADEGDLRHYLKQNLNEFGLHLKFFKLGDIAKGLNSVHEQGLIHRDFHPGNMLSNITICITDLGLSRSINLPQEEGQIFGVLPYVEPEVLQGKPYT